MFELTGKYASAKVFASLIDPQSVSQVVALLNQPIAADTHPRFMPDCHAGAGCVVGTTMRLTDKVCPDLVGVDVGCGMLVVKLHEKDVDLPEFDRIVRRVVPSGFGKQTSPIDCSDEVEELRSSLVISQYVSEKDAQLSVGTLGGGNHFIELDTDIDTGDMYLVIHTGSRHFGLKTAVIYHKLAWKQVRGIDNDTLYRKQQALIAQMKANGMRKQIQATLKATNFEIPPDVPESFAYCTGALLDDYIHDAHIAQLYASLNRKTIADAILSAVGLTEEMRFESVHNYIDVSDRMIRKGATPARIGQKLIIPISMRDGSLICIGKGNPDWNQSAPHGAGRRMSRAEAKANISMDDFRASMQGIYTTSVNEGTIDESPMAYKGLDDILPNIADTADVVAHILPVYNFKAGAEDPVERAKIVRETDA